MDYIAQIAVFFLIYTVLATSLNLISGYGGMFTVAQGAHFGIGAYAYAVCATKLGWSPLWSVLAAVAITTIAVAVLSAPASRLRGDYLVVATLALQIVFTSLFENVDAVTNGQLGIVGIPFFDVVIPSLGVNGSYALLCLVVAVLAVVFVAYCVRSPWGRVLTAIREDEVAAAALGKRVMRTKVVAFGVAGALASVSGILYAAFVSFIDPSSFTIVVSIDVLAMVLIGGSGNKYGPIVGAAIIVGLPEVLRPLDFPSNVDAQLDLMIVGLLLVVFMVLRPEGVVPERVGSPGAAGDDEQPVDPGAEMPGPRRTPERAVAPERDDRIALSVRSVNRQFDGRQVVNDVSLEVRSGEVLGVVGPNGAGKTVLLDIVTGFVRPDSGAIVLGGRVVGRSRPEDVARMGMVRLFQEQRVFPKLTVMENVMLGFGGQPREAALRVFDRRPAVRAREAELRERALDLLRLVGLSGRATAPAGSLSGGQQRLVSVARAFAADPKVLLLDEPCAGVAPRLVETLREVIRDVAARGTAVLVVEHNVDFVRTVADRVAFLAEGKVLREGSAEDVLADDELSRVYFGVQRAKPSGDEPPRERNGPESMIERSR